MKFRIALVALLSFVGLSLLANPKDIRERLLDEFAFSVVKLTGEIPESGGTGFFVRAPSGKVYILSNAHVCRIGRETGRMVLREQGPLEGRYTGLSILERDDDSDLCLLEAPGAPRDAIELADGLRVFEHLYVIGHPLLLDNTLTEGHVLGREIIPVGQPGLSAEDCQRPGRRWMGLFGVCAVDHEAMVSNIPILPGNSGSPVLNQDGRLVGVAFAGNSQSGQSFFVPLERVKAFLSRY